MPEHESPIFLRGRKINLRPLQKSDMAKCTQWVNDEEVRNLLVNFFPISLEEELAWYENIAKSKPNNLLLALETPDGEYIGNMGIHKINWRDRVGTTGAMIGEKKYWGQGLGTEAKTLLLHYAFDSMNLRKICSQTVAFNGRSKRYSEKCGYKVEGIFRNHVFRNGVYHDLVNLAVFREDFEPVWRAYTNG